MVALRVVNTSNVLRYVHTILGILTTRKRALLLDPAAQLLALVISLILKVPG